MSDDLKLKVSFFLCVWLSLIILVFSINESHSKTTNEVLVTDNLGGEIRHFVRDIKKYNKNNTLVKIEGDCMSACTLFLSLDNVCIYPSTRFWFHSAFYIKDNVKHPHYYMNIAMYKTYPGWVQSWLDTVPPLVISPSTMMPYDLPFKHVRLCKE